MEFIEILKNLELTELEWTLAILSCIMVGAAKTGLAGAGLLAVPILANIFGGKLSTGLLLPMLCLADIIAVSYYNRHADWHYLIKLIPWTLIGVAIGVLVGNGIPDDQFKMLIGIVIFICLLLMIYRDIQKNKLVIPDSWLLSAGFGLLGGFATMIGNAAGPIMAIYLLSMRLPKNNYIGTAAWFFLIINFSKIPLQAFIWETINIDSLSFNLSMVPAILIGIVTGIYIVKIIPERGYRIFIMFSTAAAAASLLFN